MPKDKLQDHAPVATRRKRRSAAEIVDRLIDAACIEFEQGGYAGATTAAIARRAEVTEAQLFRHFGSKAGLFREAVFAPLNRHFADFHARHIGEGREEGPFRDMARLYIGELQEFIDRHSRMLMTLIVAKAYGPESVKGLEEIEGLRAYFDQGAATMRARLAGEARVAPELMVRVSFAAVLASVMFKDWMFPKGLASDEEIETAIVDFVIDGLNANPQRAAVESA